MPLTPSVLLVDDRDENLFALEAVLEPLPCRLVSVTSGEAALRAMLQEDFSVVLLDVQMPGMDGFECAELIKQRKRTRTVPIIFVTAISKEPKHVFRGYETGAVDYVFKPYDPVVLRSKVSVFLELDAKTRAAEHSEAVLRAAFESAPVGMARVDLEGRIAEANRALAELVGHDAADLRDRLLDSLWAAEDAHSDADRRAALLAGGLARYEHETRAVASSGEEIPVVVSFALAQPRGTAPSSVIVQVLDLRDRKRAEQEREQLIREQAARAQAEQVSERLAAVQRISDASLGALAFDPLVEELLRRTIEVLGADTAAIVLNDSPSQTACVFELAAGLEMQRRSPAEAAGLLEAATVLEAPLQGEDGDMGLLQVGTIFPRHFSSADETMLRLAASRAGQAIERVQLFEREHQIAEELQRSLLPERLPDVSGVELAARYFAAGPGSQVGGDWYDVVVQPDGGVLLVVGDVAGRGIKAAAAMGQLRSALRAYAFDLHSPASLLERMNAFQAGMRPRGMATLTVVRVSPERDEVVYAKGGHPPALLVGPDHEPRWLDQATGIPLGAVDDAEFTEATATLEPGSTLVLYTDGLVEHRGETLDQGLDRLISAVQSGPDDFDALGDHIVEHTLADPHVDDDVTLLVLRTAPVSAEQDFAGGPEAPALARAYVQRQLSGTLDEGRLDDVSLAVSELVANAFVHGGASEVEPLSVRIEERPGAIRFCVTDRSQGNGTPTMRPPDPLRPSGMGLRIVDALADEWGVSQGPATQVWFEVAR